MINLFWRTFLAPQFRNPSLFLTGILGVAFCVSLFFSMGIASEKALKTIEGKGESLLVEPKHPDLETYKLSRRQGRLKQEDVEKCFRKAHLGLVCRASVQINLKDETTERRISVSGVIGSFATNLSPIFSEDLPQNVILNGITVQQTSVTPKLTETIILHHRDLRTIVGKEIGFDSLEISPALFVTMRPEEWAQSVHDLLEEIGDKKRFLLQRDKDQIKERMSLTSSYRLNLMILTATSILVAGLFLWNIAALQIHGRRRLLAVLRQQGISRKAGLSLLLAEQISIGLVGSIFGLVLGVFLEKVVSHLTLKTLSELYIQSTYIPEVASFDNAIAALVFGVTFYLIACSQLTLRLLFITPQDLRTHQKRPRNLKFVKAACGIVSILSFPLAIAAPNFQISLFSERSQPYFAYIAAFFVFVLVFTASGLAYRFTKFCIVLIQKLGIMVSFPTWRIAATQFLRGSIGGGTSIATVASALTLSLGIALMVASFRTSVTEWFDQVFVADIVVSGKDLNATSDYPIIPQRLVHKIEEQEDSDGYDCLTRTEGQFQTLPITVFGVSYNRPGTSRTPLVFLDKRNEMRTISQFKNSFAENEVAVNEPLANRYGIAIGDEIEVSIGLDGLKKYTVIAILQDYGSEGGYVLLPSSKSRSLDDIEGCHSLRLYSKSQSTPDFLDKIQSLDKDQRYFSAITTSKLRKFVVETFNQTFAITDVMTFLAVILGGLALLVHVAQSTYDKKDEWLALRRIGTSWKELWKIALWDSVFVLSTGSILGIICGLILAWIMVFLINVKSFGWSFQMNTGLILQEGGSVVVVFSLILTALSALLTLRLIRPGERWQRWRE